MSGKFQKYLLFALLLSLPTQLAYHFWPSWAFVFGLRVDFLAPAIYLTDTLSLVLIVLNLKLYKPAFKYLLALALFATLNTFASASVPESAYRWVKVFEFALLAIYLAKQNVFASKTIIKIVFYSSAIFSVIGIFQFFLGRTIGGLLYWLGERSFNLGTPGIALISIDGAEHLRAYSTFSHPNSLAGFLGAVLILSLASGAVKKTFLNAVCTVLISLSFFLTFSLNAYFAILIVLIFLLLYRKEYFFRRGMVIFIFASVVLSLGSPLFAPVLLKILGSSGENILERLDLSYMTGLMVSNNFLTGVGLGSFIVNIPGIKGMHTYSWLLQPVHNVYLLVLAETGIVGLLAFCGLLYRLVQKSLSDKRLHLVLSFLFLMFTGLFDHYPITLQQNLLLFCLLAGLTFRK